MECIRVKKLLKSEAWFYVKAAFLIIGLFGAYSALSSGSVAEDIYDNPEYNHVVEVHEGWANSATNIYLVLAIFYVVIWFNKYYRKLLPKNEYVEKTWRIIIKIKDIIFNTPLIWIIAGLGLVTMVVTGALGGILVYGKDFDPIMSIIYNLFF